LPPVCEGAEIVAFCPEVAAGFGVPREKIEIRDGRAVRICDGVDVTPQLKTACDDFLASLAAPPDMFILKSRSPSCGADVRGIWAEAVRERFPDARILTY